MPADAGRRTRPSWRSNGPHADVGAPHMSGCRRDPGALPPRRSLGCRAHLPVYPASEAQALTGSLSSQGPGV